MIDLYSEFIVKDFVVSKTKKGDPMGNLNLENCDTGEILNCKIWDNNLRNISKKALRPGNTVRIIDGDYNPEYKNCILKDLELIKEASTGFDKKQRDEMFNKILEVVNGFSPELKKSVSEIIMKNEKLFKVAPAAVNMHHNYIGGLMQHILECMEFYKAITPLFMYKVDSEIILAACIMHDFGKIFEYKIDLETGLVEYNEDFKKDWISHTQYGFCWAKNHGFDELARIIAAHHGRSDWGALVDLGEKNLEPVLYLMHHIDDLSAKFGAVSTKILEEAL